MRAVRCRPLSSASSDASSADPGAGGRRRPQLAGRGEHERGHEAVGHAPGILAPPAVRALRDGSVPGRIRSVAACPPERVARPRGAPAPARRRRRSGTALRPGRASGRLPRPPPERQPPARGRSGPAPPPPRRPRPRARPGRPDCGARPPPAPRCGRRRSVAGRRKAYLASQTARWRRPSPRPGRPTSAPGDRRRSPSAGPSPSRSSGTVAPRCSSGRCARSRPRRAGPSAPAPGPGRRRPPGAPAGAGRRRRG